MIYTKPRDEVFASAAPPSEIQDFEAWTRGLGIAFVETNGFPEMTGINGLFNALNIYIKYLEQNGLSEWSSTMEYPIGAGIRVGANWYKAKTQNTNKPPATSQADWELLLNASALTYQNPIYVENNVIKVRDASNTQKGVVQFASSTEIANKQNVSKAINPANASTISKSTDIGVDQSWQNLLSIRANGTTYTNSTGKPIQVFAAIQDTDGYGFSVLVNGVTLVSSTLDLNPYGFYPFSFIVPNGQTYKITWSGSNSQLISWAELR